MNPVLPSGPAPSRSHDAAVGLFLALFVAGTILILQPLVEAPRNDDFSYARSAEALARTGRIVYNGWGSPILLPQIAYGALIIQLFGFSYRALAMTGIAAAALSTLAMYALARACGCSRLLSTLATALLTLNPVFLSLAPSFMSDVPSLLLLLLALLVLVRSLRKAGEGTEGIRLEGKGFLVSVALGVLAGCNRQVSWAAYLGALLALIALLPAERRRIAGGALGVLACAVLLTHWFNQQPYTVPVNVVRGLLSLVGYTEIALMFTYKILNMLGLFLLPPALLALTAKRGERRNGSPALLAALLAICLLLLFYPLGLLNGTYGLSPTGKYFTSRGVVVGGMHGLYAQPHVLPPAVSHALTILGAVGLALTAYALLAWGKQMRGVQAQSTRTVEQVAVAAVAFASVGQLLASVPYWAQSHISDRHLLLYLPGLLIALCARATEGKPPAPVLGAALCLVAGMALLGVGFASAYMGYTRAQSALYHGLIRRGVSPGAIDGGFEFNADTQVRLGGHINNEEMFPREAYDSNAKGRFVHPLPEHFPVLDVRYVLSLDPYPQLDFPLDLSPVAQTSFRSPFPPYQRTMYVLRVQR